MVLDGLDDKSCGSGYNISIETLNFPVAVMSGSSLDTSRKRGKGGT